VAIAFVCINIEPASMAEVLHKVRAIEGVEEAEMTYGVYDVIAKVKGDTFDKLEEIITERIRKVERVQSTVTLMVVGSE
jgi:DNA-binding Lrp family transcriptional regulator